MHLALKRFLYFIIITYFITLFILYYITCFNYRYYYIISEWIKSSIFIFISIQILTISVILVESSLIFNKCLISIYNNNFFYLNKKGK